jgi:hypothetical protein
VEVCGFASFLNSLLMSTTKRDLLRCIDARELDPIECADVVTEMALSLFDNDEHCGAVATFIGMLAMNINCFREEIGALMGPSEVRILCIGCQDSGKTTWLNELKHGCGNDLVTIPTIGFNVETVQYRRSSFTIW